jgi:uncharacterized repeat protein (TIGR01451 family)
LAVVALGAPQAQAQSSLSISMTDAPDPVTAGSNLTYSITASSIGLEENVGFTDALPAGTTFQSLSVPGGWSCLTPSVGSGGTITCDIGVINGSVNATIVVNVGSGVSGTLTNTATLVGSTTVSATATTSVTGGSTSTTLVSSLNPSRPGQSVTFTATVASGAGVPTGTVTFLDQGSAIGTVALAGGTAQLTTSALAAGNHPIVAVYNPSGGFTTSRSAVLRQIVRAGGDTATSLVSSLNPSQAGNPVTFTATVTGSGVPTGTVTFQDGGRSIGTVTLSAGTAQLTTSSLSPGTHSIVAIYNPSGDFTTSRSSVLRQSVVPGGTTATQVVSSLNPSRQGEAVTFTATVTSPGGTPTGTVTFRDGGAALGTARLSGGVARFSTNALRTGTHSITAVYSPTGSFTASTSAVLQQAVGVPIDSLKLAALQAAVTKIVALNSGAAFARAVDSAVSEGFKGSKSVVSQSGNALRINFAAEGEKRTTNAFDALAYAGKGSVATPTPEKVWLPWMEIGGSNWNTSAAAGDIRGDHINTILGTSYKLSPNLLVGAFGGYETFDYTSHVLDGRVNGTGWTGGGYLGWRLMQTLNFDAAVAYSSLDYNAIAGTARGSFNAGRWFATASLSGQHEFGAWELEPSVRLHAVWERDDAYTDSLGFLQTARSFSNGRVSSGGKATYTVPTSADVSFSPYAGLYGDYYFTSDDMATTIGQPPVAAVKGWSARVVSGLGMEHRSSGASVMIGTEVGGLGSGDHMNWVGRGRFSVPF